MGRDFNIAISKGFYSNTGIYMKIILYTCSYNNSIYDVTCIKIESYDVMYNIMRAED